MALLRINNQVKETLEAPAELSASVWCPCVAVEIRAVSQKVLRSFFLKTDRNFDVWHR